MAKKLANSEMVNMLSADLMARSWRNAPTLTSSLPLAPHIQGVPKKTHFQNCHELAAGYQLPATRSMWWLGVDHQQPIHDNSESAFFLGHPVQSR